MLNNCGHIFKYDKFIDWVSRNQSCPNCRYNFLANSQYSSYLNSESNERLILTRPQFRRFLVNHIFRSFNVRIIDYSEDHL